MSDAFRPRQSLKNLHGPRTHSAGRRRPRRSEGISGPGADSGPDAVMVLTGATPPLCARHATDYCLCHVKRSTHAGRCRPLPLRAGNHHAGPRANRDHRMQLLAVSELRRAVGLLFSGRCRPLARSATDRYLLLERAPRRFSPLPLLRMRDTLDTARPGQAAAGNQCPTIADQNSGSGSAQASRRSQYR